MEETIHGKLVAKKNGIYTIYVFETKPEEFIMCTQLPNWGVYNIEIGDTGYLTYDVVNQGEKYIERETGEEKTYRFSNIYFKEFVPDVKTKDIIL